MVSSRHEAMHRIFQKDPGVFARAFRALDIHMSPPRQAAILSPDVTEISPLERRVDTVIKFDFEDGRSLIVAIEAQSDKKLKKPGAWAYYAAYLHEKYRLPVIILCVCQDAATARWARGPFVFGLPGISTLTHQPFVLGPHNVPVISDAAQAACDIPLAVLSAVTHANDPGVGAILKALAAALKTVDDETARLFLELTEIGLGKGPAAQTWSKMMAMDTYFSRSFFRSPTSQRIRAEGWTEAILDALSARGIDVSDAERERILACEHPKIAKVWFNRAMVVDKTEDIFVDRAS